MVRGRIGFDGGKETEEACRGPTHLVNQVDLYKCRINAISCLTKACRFFGVFLQRLRNVDQQDSEPGRLHAR